MSKKVHFYPNDPPDAECPYCHRTGRPCSHVSSMTRAYARASCKRKNAKQEGTDQ